MFGVNISQLALAAVIYIVAATGLRLSYTINGLFFGLQGLIWLIFGYITSLGCDMTKPKGALVYSLLSVLPITVLLSLCVLLGAVSPEGTTGWAQFFFFGAPLGFFLKPAVFLNILIKNSAYLIYAADIFILVCASFVGCLVGNESNKKKKRSKKETNVQHENDKPKRTKSVKTADAENKTEKQEAGVKAETDAGKPNGDTTENGTPAAKENNASDENKKEPSVEVSETELDISPEITAEEKRKADKVTKTVGKKSIFNTVKKQKKKKTK